MGNFGIDRAQNELKFWGAIETPKQAAVEWPMLGKLYICRDLEMLIVTLLLNFTKGIQKSRQTKKYNLFLNNLESLTCAF